MGMRRLPRHHQHVHCLPPGGQGVVRLVPGLLARWPSDALAFVVQKQERMSFGMWAFVRVHLTRSILPSNGAPAVFYFCELFFLANMETLACTAEWNLFQDLSFSGRYAPFLPCACVDVRNDG